MNKKCKNLSLKTFTLKTYLPESKTVNYVFFLLYKQFICFLRK